MSNIWIFGDSFSDPNYKFNDEDTWYNLIESETSIQIKNFSIAGVGLNYCVSKYKDNILNYSSDDYLIFLLPDHSRLDLCYLDNPNLSANTLLISRNLINVNDLSNTFFKVNFKKIKKDYDSYYKLNLHENLIYFYLSYILMTCKIFKKVFLIGCNENFYTYDVKTFIEDHVQENTYFYPTSLLDISSNELINKSTMFLKDHRNNHLSENNHMLFKNVICNFLFFNDRTEEKFEKDFINVESI